MMGVMYKFLTHAEQEAPDPNTPPERLGVLEQALRHGMLPTERRLAALLAVVRNPSTPADALFRLAVDYPDEVLQNPIWALWIVADPGFVQRLPQQTAQAIAGCSTVGEGLLRALAGTNRRPVMVRAAAAANPVTPLDMLRAFRTQHFEVRKGLALNPALAPDWQIDLARDPSVYVRQAFASRTDAHRDLLAEIAHEPYLFPNRAVVRVHTTVAANPRTPSEALVHLNELHDWWVHHALQSNPSWPVPARAGDAPMRVE